MCIGFRLFIVKQKRLMLDPATSSNTVVSKGINFVVTKANNTTVPFEHP
jgi:hypothetical protein